MDLPKPIPVDALCRRCKPEVFDFESTDSLEPLEDVIGQARAVDAIRFGIDMQRSGYHIFAHGPDGSGKSTTVRSFLQRVAAERPTPSDWCYVYRFDDEHSPKALRLPSGRGPELHEAMDRLVDDLLVSLPTLLRTESSRGRRRELLQDFEARSHANFEAVQAGAAEQGVAIVNSPQGLSVAPLHEGGVMERETFEALPEAQQEAIREQLKDVQERLDEAARQERRIRREAGDAIAKLEQEIAEHEVGIRIDEIREQFDGLSEVASYLDAVQKDVSEHLDFFRPEEESPAEGGGSAPSESGTGSTSESMIAARKRRHQDHRLRRYMVNVFVCNKPDSGAPVISERYPSLINMVGRIEHEQRMGALVTDFTLIRPGALQLANGGYLVIEADELLSQPFSWEALKRALDHEEARIEIPGDEHNPRTTISLEPEPIPLDFKVILIGSTPLYFGLHEGDPDVADLFKVGAEFAASMPRTPENEQLYARFIATVLQKESMLPFDNAGVARIVQHSSRLASDQQRLSTHFMDVTDLLREADFWARQAGVERVSCQHVDQAIQARVARNDLSRNRMLESVAREIMLIDTEGEALGQVNGLTVLTRGDFRFGMPSRITARVRAGRGKVTDIEREVALSGPFHAKGVLILSGYLSGKFVPDDMLAIAASLTFEQSYSAVDGDSASSTELYALLSALSGLPIHQRFAVTGAVSQVGEVQAIGGANEKIEGFFDVCRQRGLTGDQGVLIPVANVQHLMLREDVVEAVEEGRFQIYPIASIDEGISLLTGVPAGEADAEGRYPADTVNGRVQRRLLELADRQRFRLDVEPAS